MGPSGRWRRVELNSNILHRYSGSYSVGWPKIAPAHAAENSMKSWWAREDSNLQPSGYERAESIAKYNETNRLRANPITFEANKLRGFIGCPLAGRSRWGLIRMSEIFGRHVRSWLQALEPTAEGEGAYVQEVRSLARMGQRFYMECTPGYYNSEGAVGNRSGFFSDMYGAGPLAFFDKLAEWRGTGELPGMALS